MKSIVLTGGGTAGHVIPSLALVDDLKQRFDKIYYMGENGGIEERLSREYGLEFFGTSAVKFDRSKLMSNVRIPYRLYKSVRQAKKILNEIKPQVVFAKGGYASLPCALASKSVGAKLVIHESDMSLGLANKICFRYADKVLTSFEGTCKNEIVVGNPVRRKIFDGKTPNIIFSNDLPTILVTGGSLGSKTINQCIERSTFLLDEYNVIHIVGKSPVNIKHPNYYAFDYYDEIQDLYHVADVVISRGGANSLSEITALGKRAIIIPLPKGVSRGDQMANARYYQNRGMADVLLEENLSGEELKKAIENALKKNEREVSKTIANDLIIEEIEKLI